MHHNMMRTMVNTVGWMDAGTHRLIPCAFVYSSSVVIVVVVVVAEIAQVFASSPSRRHRASCASCSSAPGWLAVVRHIFHVQSLTLLVVLASVVQRLVWGELRGNEENSFRRVPWENLSCYWRTDYNFYYLCLNRISKFAPERELAEYLLLWGWLVCASFPTLISLRTCNQWKGSANKSEFTRNERCLYIQKC